MKLLPVVERELRVASRKWATYWERSGIGFGCMVVAGISLRVLEDTPSSQTGLVLFVWLSAIAFLQCLLTGMVLTADALSEEKRENTLGLLFLTDLKGYDVVLGKLAASSLRGFYGMLGIFPVLAVCLLLGGVTAGEFGRVMLVCINNLFLSMAIGMLASAVCRDERKAMAGAFFVLLLLTLGFPLLGVWLKSPRALWTPASVPFVAMSPAFPCFIAFEALYKPQWFWPAVGLQGGLGCIALFIACRIVPHSWQDRVASPAGGKSSAAAASGAQDAQAAFRRRLLAINPYYWLTSRERIKQALPWLVLGVAGLVWAWGLAFAPRVWKDQGMYLTSALVLHSFFKAWMALEASRRLGADRKSGALELLLCTPLSVTSILRGQWMGLMRQFGLPVAIIGFSDAVFFSAGLSYSDRGEWAYTWFCGVTVFLADMATLAWLGMWRGVTARRSAQGGVSALVQVCALPWLVFSGILAIGLIAESTGGKAGDSGNGPFLLWWLISMGIDAALGVHAYRQLHSGLRAIASERYIGAAAAWGRALGKWYGQRRSPPGKGR